MGPISDALSCAIAAAAAGVAWGLGYAVGRLRLADALPVAVDADRAGALPLLPDGGQALTICADCLRPVSACIDCTPRRRAIAMVRRAYLWPWSRRSGL